MSEQLGNRLEQLMREKGLNQGEMARRLECSPAFVSDVIRNKKKPGAEFLAKVSENFNISLDWLVCGKSVDPVSGRINSKISFDAYQAIALRTELVLAALKGNKAAIILVQQLVQGQKPILQGTEFDSLTSLLKSRIEEHHFLVEHYNNRKLSDNLEDLAAKAFKAAYERFTPLYEDPIFKIINY